MTALLAAGDVAPASRVFEAAGRRLHYLETGDGPPVVLLHGAGGGGANWYRVIGPLSGAFRVLAPDLPGFGLSDPLPDAPARDALGVEAARALHDWLVDVVRQPCDVIGTSFGGLAALRLAQANPGAVRRLILLDSVGLGRQLPAIVRAAALRGLGRLLLVPTRTGTDWLFRTLLVSDASNIPAREREALVDYLHASARISARTLGLAMRRFAGAFGQLEILADDELARLTLPTLVLWGERDRFLPPGHGERAARVMPDASFAVIPGAGHSPNWERPAEVADAMLRFLRAA